MFINTRYICGVCKQEIADEKQVVVVYVNQEPDHDVHASCAAKQDALKKDIRECLGVACNELVSAQGYLSDLRETGDCDEEEIDEAIEELDRLWDEVWSAWTGDHQ